MLSRLLKNFKDFFKKDAGEKKIEGVTSAVLGRQNIRLLIVGSCFFVIGIIVIGWFIKSPNHRRSEPVQEKTGSIEPPSSHERSAQQARIELLAQKNDDLVKNTQKNQEIIENLEKKIVDQNALLERQKSLEQAINNIERQNYENRERTNKSLQDLSKLILIQNKKEPPAAKETAKKQLAIAAKTAQKKVKTIKNYIPAGSFVDATIIGGLDVSTAVTARNEPNPVLLYVTDIAQLPNMSKQDIEYCHVTCAGYGDLSSERALIRTERLSCVKKDGRILEVPIKAYVTDESGKNGVRGNVVYRDGDLLTQSFFAAGFGSLGAIASSAAVSRLPIDENIDWKQSIQANVIQGTGMAIQKSTSRLEDYLIKRLEAISPIIQVQAGRKVNIVISEGLFIDQNLGE